MIPHLPGWAREYDGDTLVLSPAGDPDRGQIRYREHLGTPAPPEELLAAQLALDPELEIEDVTAPEALVTHEGEYAALVNVRCRLDGLLLSRDIGGVYGDAHVARVAAVTGVEEAFADFTRTVRELVLGDQHHLGVRRRRFRHDAPRGWRARTRGFATTVYQAPGFPALIDVSPAVPWHSGSRGAEALLEAAGGAGVVIERRRPAEAVRTAGGLTGSIRDLTCVQGSERYHRRVASLVDEQYLYCLRLDSKDGAGREIFDEVVRSVEPIPLRRHRARAAAVSALAHWC